MLDYRTHTFLTLCQEMNYRKTAALLNMTQPGVTQHIHALEREYGCSLFSYDNRKLTLTRQGELFRDYLQRVQYDEGWLRQRMHEAKTPALHIGATKSIGDYMISPQLGRLLESGMFTVDLLVDNTQTLLEGLKKGTLDFAMIEGNFDKSDFGHEKMWDEPYTGICAADHPFAGRTVPPEEILTQHLLLREEGSGTRSILEQQLKFFNESISSFTKVNCISSFRVMKDIIAAGNAISFGYLSIIRDDRRLSHFAVEGFSPAHPLYYVYQPNTHAKALLQQYLQLTGEKHMPPGPA